jgi:hypothetical protein
MNFDKQTELARLSKLWNNNVVCASPYIKQYTADPSKLVCKIIKVRDFEHWCYIVKTLRRMMSSPFEQAFQPLRPPR